MPNGLSSNVVSEEVVDTVESIEMEFKQPSIDQPSRKGSVSSASSAFGRNKVALKPGRSLMDWIRYTHSGKDLTSTGGRIMVVSYEELCKHNKKDDAWICLKGKVYNVTPYFEYHPGGEDELMKGVGRDATSLFNQIHRWVNAESMLQKCFVGPLKSPSLWLHSDVDEASNEDSKPEKLPHRFDWSQTKSDVHILIYNTKNERPPYVMTDLKKNKLIISIKSLEIFYKYQVDLEKTVLLDYGVSENKERNAIEIVINKKSKDFWKNVNFSLLKTCSVNDINEKDMIYRPCKLIGRSSVNYNTVLLSLKLPQESRMLVPIGCHIQVKVNYEGNDFIRSYTPVHPSLLTISAMESHNLHLMLKVYDKGIATPLLNQWEIGETILISDYIGNFSEDKIRKCSSLVMIAGGTGVTPMFRIIMLCLQLGENELKDFMLLFFNKSERDILWINQLNDVAEKDKRFSAVHVLSEPDASWTGPTGVITKELLQDIITTPATKESNAFFCVCGPIAFTQLGGRYLRELGYSEESIYQFGL